MALNFPDSPPPVIGDTFTAGGATWQWDGSAWVVGSPIVSKVPAGYILGGWDGSFYFGAYHADKFRFSDDTRSTLSSFLHVVRGSHPASFSSSTNGYACGGYTIYFSSSIQKLTFVSDSFSLLTAALEEPVAYSTGFSSTTHGYRSGGNGAVSGNLSSIEKMEFSSEAMSSLSSSLSFAAKWCASNIFSGTSGYVVGSGASVTVEKVAFSTDTVSQTADAPALRERSGGFSSSTSGYLCGGWIDGSVESSVWKLSFSSETFTTLAVGLSSARNNVDIGLSSTTSGYAAGGEYGYVATTATDKFSYSDDTRSTLYIGLSEGTATAAGLSSI